MAAIFDSFTFVDSHKEVSDYVMLVGFLCVVICVLAVCLYAAWRGGMELANEVIAKEDENELLTKKIVDLQSLVLTQKHMIWELQDRVEFLENNTTS